MTYSQSDRVPALSAAPVRSTKSNPAQKSYGEARTARHARMITTIADRLNAVTSFGTLEERDLYTIGQLSEYLQVSLRTLRFYEQAGLLRPSRKGTKRLYSRQDLDQLKVIVTLRELEASLGAIGNLLHQIAEVGQEAEAFAKIEGLLVAIAASNHQRIEELSRLNKRIDAVIGSFPSRT